MGLRVHTKYEAEIDELSNRFECLNELKDKYRASNLFLRKNDLSKWYVNYGLWNCVNQLTYHIQIMFIGKTGYGKSTTLNEIVGKNVFETNDVSACTKDLYEAVYRIDDKEKIFFSLCDLPGVAESEAVDEKYYRWYEEMLNLSKCVVYVLRADQRDYSADETIFSRLFCKPENKKKVILALNFADKIEPINRKEGLSLYQRENLRKKMMEVSNIFDFPLHRILYYSAADKINIYRIMEQIMDVLRDTIIHG